MSYWTEKIEVSRWAYFFIMFVLLLNMILDAVNFFSTN